MAIQFLRGDTAANDGYTGPVGSLTVDTEVGTIRIHDGVTAGGWIIGNVDESGNINTISGTSPIVISGTTADPVIEIKAATPSQDGSMSSEDKSKLDGMQSGAEVNDVNSVNTQTGSVVLDSDDIEEGVSNLYFTDSEKTKLSGVEEGAEVNTVDSVNGQTGEVTIPNADEGTDGLMSTGSQTFSGNKTFSGVVTIDEGAI